jgi:ABC-type molybdate transport system permease subunit
MKEIISIEDMGAGQVVSIEVEEAHTYIANNVISHNIKFGSAMTYFATAISEFTATITKVGGGDTQTATFVLEAYSGMDLR